MSIEQADLSLLVRSAGEGPSTSARSVATHVPMPKSRWRTRILLPGAILGAAALLLAYAARDALTPALEVRVIPVMAKTGAHGTAAITVQAPGWVEADPFAHAVSALADGVVKEVLVLEGEPVAQGQVVARLVDDDARLALTRAEAELAERQAALHSAEAALTAAQSEWDHPVELTRKAATARAMLAEQESELRRLPFEVKAETARADELEAEFQRLSPMQGRQVTEIEVIRSRQQTEAQRAVAAATQAREPMIQARIDALEAEVLAASENLRLRIQEKRSLEAARAEWERVKASVQVANAVADEARLRLERMEVRSPVDGVVMLRLVEPGSKLMLSDNMPTSAQVARLYQPSKLQVRVDVPLADAAAVGVGQAAQIVVDVLPNRVFLGRLTRVAHEADLQKNTLQVKVAIEDPSPELKPEMLARVKFLSAAREAGDAQRQAVFAPESLVLKEAGGQARVWLVDQTRNVCELRPVTVGTNRIDRWVEIAEGLRMGDRLIAEDPSRLRSGRRVRITGELADHN